MRLLESLRLSMLTLAGLAGFAANAQTSDRPRLVAQLASGQVIACAYSPDGRSALTGGREGKARLWDVATGEELQFFQGEAWITHVAVSSDNRNVLTRRGRPGCGMWILVNRCGYSRCKLSS